MTIVLGADACKDKLVVIAISEIPEDPQAFHQGGEFEEIPTNAEGLKRMLEIKPDVVVMEPTGIKYIKFWLTNLARAGIEVRLVHNCKLPKYRDTLGLPDKDDYADALALACYYLQYHAVESRWCRQRDPDVCKIRELILRIESLERSCNVFINRLKQSLASEFPEMASATKGAVLFWSWLAGRRENKRYDALLAACEGALGISSYTRFDAKILDDLLNHIDEVEGQLKEILALPKFKPYTRVFWDWKIGDRMIAVFIGQIFPLESFLEEGKPIVRITPGKKSQGKKVRNKTKKRIGLRKFKKCMGLAPVREYSGSSLKRSKKSGSAFARKTWWRWVFSVIERKMVKLPDKLKGYRDWIEKAKATPATTIFKSRATLAQTACKDLFYDLVRSVNGVYS